MAAGWAHGSFSRIRICLVARKDRVSGLDATMKNGGVK